MLDFDFKRLKKAILNRPMLNQVLVLLLGTGSSRVLVFLFSPIISRLYFAEDFGVFAVFNSVVFIFSVVAALRYELAIPIPKSEQDAFHVLLLAIISTISFAGLMFVVILFQSSWRQYVPNFDTIKPFIWLIPLGVIGTSIFQICSFWAIRKRDFQVIAKTTFGRSVISVLLQIVFGSLKVGPAGLIISDIVSRFGGFGSFFILFKSDLALLKKVSFSEILRIGREFRKFPMFSAWASLFNSVSLHLPDLFFPLYYGAKIGGLFVFANYVIGLSLGMLSQSVGQVFLGEAAILLKKNSVDVRRLLLRTAKNLFLLFSIPIIIFCIFSPTIFSVIFGPSWQVSGEYVRLLAVNYILQSAIVPISSIINLSQHQVWQILWDATRVLLISTVFYFCERYHLQPEVSIMLFSAAMSFMYVVLFILSVGVTYQSGRSRL